MCVVGAGNAGRAYISAALSKGYEVEFVEANPDQLHLVVQEFDGKAIGRSSLSQVDTFDSAVVATHSDSHNLVLRELVDLGARHVLVEKVLSNSVRGLEEVDLVGASQNVVVGTHNRWSLVGLPEFLGQEFGALGQLISIDSIAGCFCLSAGSIHTLALAARLFPELQGPTQVSARLNMESHSPRGEGLRVVTGQLHVETGGRSVVSLTSRRGSNNGPILIFTFDSGQVVMDLEGKMTARSLARGLGGKRDYLPWDSTAAQETFVDTSRVFEKAIEDLFDAEAAAQDFAAGVRANEILLAALASSSQGGKQLAVDRRSDWWILNRELDIHWPIT